MSLPHPHPRWNDAALEPLRAEGDLAADAAVDAVVAAGGPAAAGRLIGALAGGPAAELPAPARAFLAEHAALPPWADQRRIARGSALFGRHAPRALLILGHYALPACYAARKGVQVLHLTARLSHDPRPRLMETARFVLDVMTPGALAPGGHGVRAALCVRLMHAAVRHLTLARGWDPELGTPVNQEDMLGTLLTFSYVTLDGLRKLGFSVPDADGEDFLHAWNVVGALMGVRADILPADVPDAGAALLAIQRRHFAPCDEGRALAGALAAMLRQQGRGPLANMPASLMRFFLGDPTADMLGLPPADWTRGLMPPLRLLGWLTGEAQGRIPLLGPAAERLGVPLMRGLVR